MVSDSPVNNDRIFPLWQNYPFKKCWEQKKIKIKIKMQSKYHQSNHLKWFVSKTLALAHRAFGLQLHRKWIHYEANLTCIISKRKCEKGTFISSSGLHRKSQKAVGDCHKLKVKSYQAQIKKCSKLIECSSRYQYFHRLLMKSYWKTRGQDRVSEEEWLITSPHPHSLYSFFFLSLRHMVSICL